MKWLLYLLAMAAPVMGAEISGRVVDARGGEGLARVRVRAVGVNVYEASTALD